MTWESFWASVFPAYLGAIGSIAASAVAVVALVRDIRTRKGLNEVAQSASSTVELPEDRATILPRSGDAHGGDALELLTRGRRTAIRNLAPDPVEILKVSVPSGGKSVTVPAGLPAAISPGEGLAVVVRELWSGPAIAAVRVEWRDPAGRTSVSTFFV
jgi:hypothetical protein